MGFCRGYFWVLLGFGGISLLILWEMIAVKIAQLKIIENKYLFKKKSYKKSTIIMSNLHM